MPSKSTSASLPHVLIIGGGISGLALAHGFQKYGISFHLYERDHTQTYRAQGYRFRITSEAVEALRYLLDPKTWKNFETTCGEMKYRPGIPSINAETAEIEVSNKPQQHNPTKPLPRTVDRTVFRDVLLQGLPAAHVSYGKSFQRYEETFSGVRAFFTDGNLAEGTLLVGADGTRSRVRQQYLPDIEVIDAGVTCIYGKTPLTLGLIERLEPEIMGGISGIKDRSHEYIVSMVVEPIIFPNRDQMVEEGSSCPQNYLYWALVAKPQALGLPFDGSTYLTGAESEELALEVTRGWHPSLRAVLEHQLKGETATLPMSSVKSDFGTWEPRKNVALIGDSIHPMVAAGSGAIVALQDAHTLCRVLVEEGQSKASIEKYEEEMRVYASNAVTMSWSAQRLIFGRKSDNDRPIGEIMEELRAKRAEQSTVAR